MSKDFKIRYRNMSLGAFWSLLNPLVMMAVLTFVFAGLFKGNEPRYPVFVLCGIVPYNFFALAWSSGTSSLVDNAQLMKRVPIPREIIPIASVLSHLIHLGIQLALLLAFALAFGLTANVNWLFLPLFCLLEIVFVTGLSLVSSCLHVLARDTRYVVDSINTVLFWLVPIFYSFEMIPQQYKEVYQFNPIAAVVLAIRNVVLDARAPHLGTLAKLATVSVLTLLIGLIAFQRLKNDIYDHV